MFGDPHSFQRHLFFSLFDPRTGLYHRPVRPLMDNDSAHHANIAMHMYLNRDYVNLIDAGQDYLDKPHLLFWLCTLSYKILGVTSFAYRFPSFLFTILCVYSVYRLGRSFTTMRRANWLR